MTDVYLPILRDTKDPHYRYKMPKLLAKVEGSGNGIKTVIVNMTQIAKSLGRPPTYPTKFFGCELGAQVTMDHDQYIVNGAHSAEKLLDLLYSFIGKFVLCTKCKNPETNLTVQNGTIHAKCIACGHSFIIQKAMHKLTTFIINHPPNEPSSSTTNGKGAKSGKSSKSKSKSGGGSNSPTNGKEDGDLASHLAKQQEEDDDGFDDDALTKEAHEERMRALCDGFNGAIYIKDSKENADMFYNQVKKVKEQLAKDTAVQKELYAEATRLELKDKAVLIMCEILFTENIMDEIKTYKMAFLRFCHNNKKAQKYLLGGFEKLVGDVYKDKLFGQIPVILKRLYDEDILDEEVILEWAAKESKKYVSKEMSKKIHEKAAPFIKWLKEAEEEDDDEDDEDDDEDGQQPKKPQPVAANGGKQPSPTNGAKQGGKQKSSDEDDDDEDGLEVDFTYKAGDTIKVVDQASQAKAAAADKIKTAQVAAKQDEEEEDIDIDNI